VVHCDLKPANILLGGFGEVLVVDWGLAQIADSGAVVRGGTLGDMAPEQRDPRTTRLDARADLFALGAVLYEILCGRPAFAPAREASRDPGRAPSEGAPAGPIPLDYEPPPPPRPAVEGAEIDAELEALCMQALALAPERRLSSARQLAEAIDGFLEGTRERARRRSEAERSATAGDELAERYHELVEAHPEQVANVAALRAATAPWAAIEDKQELWDAEDMLRVTEALRVRTLQAAVSTYEHALDAVSNHGRARAGLARLYWSELQRARDDRNAQEQVYFEQLLRQHDDGRLVAELTREGVLEVHLGDAPVTVTLAPVIEDQRRLVCGPREELRRRPLERRMLAPGTYLVTARAPGGLEICWPVHLRPGAHCRVPADLVTTVALAADEVFVPAGAALLCGDPLSSEFSVQVTVDVPAFVLQRVPVTFAAWFAFLDALRQGEPAAVETHLPRSSLGSPYFRLDGDRWRPDHIRAVVADPDPQRLPVMGVSARSAEAYALWLAQRTGRRWRLPQENEWEKAGRGTDGRIYPWGDHFDATFCKMRDSRPGPPSPEPVASYPADVSPYGVCDMAGGVAEWCLPDPRLASRCEPGEVVSRGGAWCDWPIDCRLASRRRYIATERAARVGLRLARDP
jgi:serine/threonine-protein kinase